MRYHALACDYDGTLAHNGRVNDETVAALERLRGSGRRLIMVTGRELDDLRQNFSQLDLFDRVVAENGALLHSPKERKEKLLAEPPCEDFVRLLGGSAAWGRSRSGIPSSPPGSRTRRRRFKPSAIWGWNFM